MICKLCERNFNGIREPVFSKKPPICESCGKSLVDNLFGGTYFNEYLDSFLQSRMEIYLPYDEYYRRYHKKKCPDCNGTGLIDGKVCNRCNWIGTIEE